MKDSTHTIIYATVLGLVCSLLLTGVAESTKSRRDENRAAERMRHIFGVLGVEYGKDDTSEKLIALYAKVVKEDKLGEEPLYVYAPADVDPSLHRKAVEFAGPGLWGPIKGFLALDMELKTIEGITFHVQEETPGIGGEIVSAKFRDQFVGRSIEDKAKNEIGIRIVTGREAIGVNEVDGMTGATMTCDKVQDMLNVIIKKIIKERGSHGG